MKVHQKYSNITPKMHGVSRNYRYVWDVSVVGSDNFSIGGRSFTSSDLIPLSFIDFFDCCISSGLMESMPLFLGGGGGSGTDQSSWFLAILLIISSASSGVLCLKTQPAHLSR